MAQIVAPAEGEAAGGRTAWFSYEDVDAPLARGGRGLGLDGLYAQSGRSNGCALRAHAVAVVFACHAAIKDVVSSGCP